LRRFVKDIFEIHKYKGLSFFDVVKLQRYPRYQPIKVRLFGKAIHLVDALTFLQGIEEIFINEIYKFRSSNETPLILDCGANIGLSVIYFKSLYPGSRVIAFEPDRTIFKALEQNIAAFNLRGVELHNEAIWTSAGEIDFAIEGAYSGRIPKPGDSNFVSVKTVPLKQLLAQSVDFLKLDIEGAESDVISHCPDLFFNVSNLFVEYHSHKDEQQRLDEILSVLRAAGFRYQIKDAYSARWPFLDRGSMLGMDLQLNIFAFRHC
jgi:FkbM family methyltransferase